MILFQYKSKDKPREKNYVLNACDIIEIIPKDIEGYLTLVNIGQIYRKRAYNCFNDPFTLKIFLLSRTFSLLLIYNSLVQHICIPPMT